MAALGATLVEVKLDAFLVGEPRFPLITAPAGRPWMDATTDRYAYRCLPLLIANSYGWLLCTPSRVHMVWKGKRAKESLHVEADARVALSHFGHGILTFRVPYLFRTEPGWDMWVHGPPNYAKPGIANLEGIVETEWAPETFTYNVQVTHQNVPLTYEPGEPICMITPIERGRIEQFEPVIRPLDSDPELKEQYDAWVQSRDQFHARSEDEWKREPWQKDYFRGGSPGGCQAPPGVHQTKIKLKPVRDETT